MLIKRRNTGTGQCNGFRRFRLCRSFRKYRKTAETHCHQQGLSPGFSYSAIQWNTRLQRWFTCKCVAGSNGVAQTGQTAH